MTFTRVVSDFLGSMHSRRGNIRGCAAYWNGSAATS